MNQKKSFFGGLAIGIAIMIVINLSVMGAQFVSKYIPTETMDVNQKISRIMEILGTYYVDDIKDESLTEGIYKGLVDAVGDPYTVYFDKKSFDRFMEQTEGTYAGIGVVVSVDPDDRRITVVAPFEGSPGEKAGILPGDKILKVNNFEVYGENLEDAVSMMKGPAGTTVDLTLYRKIENRQMDVTVKRADIVIPTISHRMLEDDIGYVRISGFESKTYEQFMEAYRDLVKQNQKGMIIDLRNNPGGLLHVVTQIADELVPEGTIVYTEDKAGNQKFTRSKENRINVPLVILVNGNSASASEILAGAVKDHNVGKLVGTTTFGKGLVQSIVSLPDGSGVKVTIAKYYTPSGTSIQGIGIEPDYVVTLPEELANRLSLEEDEDIQLQKAIEVVQQQMR